MHGIEDLATEPDFDVRWAHGPLLCAAHAVVAALDEGKWPGTAAVTMQGRLIARAGVG